MTPRHPLRRHFSLGVPVHRCRGFTLIEVMIASAIGLFVIAVSLTFLAQAAHMANIMDTRMRLNDQARDFMRLISGGGGNLNNTLLTGLYGSADVTGAPVITLSPSNNTFQTNGQRYDLSGNDAAVGNVGAITFSTDQATVDIACTANNTPHQDCVGTNTLTVNGYLNGDPEIAAVGVPTTTPHCGAVAPRNTVASVEWDLIDPFRLQRSGEYLNEDTTAHYSTYIGLMVDCQP